MSQLTSILRQISNPRHLSKTLAKLQNIAIPKLTTEILLLLRNVLRISCKDSQQYSGLVVVYKVIHDSLKKEYDESDWLGISEMFADIVITIFQNILNYQNCHFMKEKAFCNLVQHAAKFLLPVVNKVDSVRIIVLKDGFTVITRIVCLEILDVVIRKDLFLLFKQILVKADSRLRKTIMNNNDQILSNLAELTLTCGDYEFQESLVEILMRFSCTSKQKLMKVKFWYRKFPCAYGFVEILDYNHFDTSCREFLNKLNNSIETKAKVITLPCLEAFANDIQLTKPNVDKFKELWVDFSTSTGVIHTVCDSGGNAWLKIYIEQSNVKTIFISTRQKKNIQSARQILFELISPLQVRLHSSEVFIATLTLLFLDGPQLTSLEQLFFQRCYNGAYKIEKMPNSKFMLKNKNESPVCHKRRSWQQFQRETKIPLMSSTPKPDPLRHTEKQSAPVNPEKPNTQGSDKSSLISYLRDPNQLDADRQFKAMYEERLFQIQRKNPQNLQALENDSQNVKENSNVSVSKQEGVGKKLSKLRDFNFENKENILSISNSKIYEHAKQGKGKEIFECPVAEDQSEDSPFYLTSQKRMNFEMANRTPLLENDNGDKNKQAELQTETLSLQKSKSELSNFEKVRNLFLSTESAPDKPFLDISGNKISSESAQSNRDSHNFLKKSMPLEKEKISYFNNSTFKANFLRRLSSNACKSETSAESDTNIAKTKASPSKKVPSNKNSPEHLNNSFSEPATKKQKLLRSPKLLNNKLNESYTKKIELLQRLSNETPFLTQNKTFDILKKPIETSYDNVSNKINSELNSFVNCNKNVLSDASKPNDIIQPNPLIESYCHGIPISSNNSSWTMQVENKINESMEKNKFKKASDIDENLELNKIENNCQPIESLPKITRQKSFRGSLKNQKLLSPNTSIHCRIPSKTYISKNSSKSVAKQLTPDKIFENLKKQKSNRESDITEDGKIVTRKRKLFNPNDSMDISSEKDLAKKGVFESPSLDNRRPSSNNSPDNDFKKGAKQNHQQTSEASNENKTQFDSKSPKLFEDISELHCVKIEDDFPKLKVLRRSHRLLKKANYIEISSDDSLDYNGNKNQEKALGSKPNNLKDKDLAKNKDKSSSVVPKNSNQESRNENEKSFIRHKKEKACTSLMSRHISLRSGFVDTPLFISEPNGKLLKIEEGKEHNSLRKPDAREESVKSLIPESKKTLAEKETDIFEFQEDKYQNNINERSNSIEINSYSNKTCRNYSSKQNKNSTPSSLVYSPNFNTDVLSKLKKYSCKMDKERKFTSLVDKLPTCEALREDEVSEMIQEEIPPVENRESEVSIIDLPVPPLHLSNEDSENRVQQFDLQEKMNNSSKINSTGTQADARAEIEFLDHVITNLEKISLGASRKKIIKEVGSLESSLKKVEMYTECSNKKLKQKCIDAQKTMETMKNNLDNMLCSCNEFLQSFQTKMTDIKSTMTRISTDIGSDQDLKMKVAEDIEKMCRERKTTITFDNFFN